MLLQEKSVEELAKIKELLVAGNLVPAELERTNLFFFLRKDGCGVLQGVVGVELYPDIALLRSLVVHEQWRRRGIARNLLAEATEFIRQAGIDEVFLLTETVEEMMVRYGFSYLEGREIPEALLASPFLDGRCSCSCRMMRKSLRGGMEGGTQSK